MLPCIDTYHEYDAVHFTNFIPSSMATKILDINK